MSHISVDFETFYDTKQDYEIRVEQKHIDKGESCNCHRCPVALAIADQVACDAVSVQGDYIRILIDGDKHTIVTPPRVTAEINEYDCTGQMRPFTFPLVIP